MTKYTQHAYYKVKDGDIMEKVIGYLSNGKKVLEPQGICCASILYCHGCGKTISSICGRPEVYCPDCASKKGIIKSKEMLQQKNKEVINN